MSAAASTAELDLLLSENVVQACMRETGGFDALAGARAQSIVVFGAGNLGKKFVRVLREHGTEPIAFADNNRDLWGASIDGVPVLSPDDCAARYGDRAAFVVALWNYLVTFRQIREQLQRLGCQCIVPGLALMWKYPDDLLPHYCLDLPHKTLQEADDARRAFALLEDDASRRVYLAFLRWRLLLDYDALPAPSGYYPEDVVTLTDHEVFVDCGAYDGDTLSDFVQRRRGVLAEAHAFEPDPANYERLAAYVAALPDSIRTKVRTYNLALGAKSGVVRFASTGAMGSCVQEDGGVEVECRPMDDVLGEKAPTYVKMDVEGAELEVLAGAVGLLSRGQTIWAITAEHRYDDLWRIPLFIQSQSGAYRFFLRSHLNEGLDLVWYAVPRERAGAGSR